MSWIWQQQNMKIRRKTEWKSPNLVSQCLPDNISLKTSKYNDPPYVGCSMIAKYSVAQNPIDFYIESIDDNPPYKSLWNNLDNVKSADNDDYTLLYSINANDQIINYSSPLISCKDFDFDLQTGVTITGIEIKITKSASSPYTPSCCVDDDYYVSELKTNNITNYTYDDVVMITLSGECNSNFYNNDLYNNIRGAFNISNNNELVPQYSFISTYKNYAKPWIGDNWSTPVSNYYNFFGFDPTPIITYNDYNIVPPKGIWSEEKKSYLYGGEDDLWGDETTTITTETINSSDFGVYFRCSQKIPRSYTGNYYNRQNFEDNQDSKDWYDYLLYPEYLSYGGFLVNDSRKTCVGREISKLYDIQIRVHYELDVVLTIDGRENIFNTGNTLKTDDVYFKFQRCFNGICYQYINDLYDIYNISLMTGDGKSINNMYNEYNVIDEYCENIYRADVATKEEIDLSNNYFQIDNVKLKPGHYVLLLDQTSATTNDIYKVDENYFLVNSNLLSTRESAYRAKVSVKLGTYKGNQYFLNDFGNQFPITGETKTFTSGHSYMVKNYIDYNIKNSQTAYTYDVSGNTIGNPNKIIFTNYKVARTLSETKNWNEIEFTPTSALTINYLDLEYTLTSEYGVVFYDMSGSTSTETYFNWSGLSYFSNDSNFFTRSSIGDHSIISFKKDDTSFTDNEIIPENSNFNYLSIIRYIDSDYVAFDEIPTYIINDVLSGSTAYTFRIRNLQFCSATTDSYEEYMRYSPYTDILSFKNINGLNIKPYDSQQPDRTDYYRYFDYNLLTINNIVDGQSTAYTFTTNNQYQNYKLKPFLDKLGTTPTTIYNNGQILSGEYTIEEIFPEYADEPHSSGISNTYYTIQSSRYKIIPTDKEKLNDFTPYTFVDFVDDYIDDGYVYADYIESGEYIRTLITEVTDEYMLIEKPRLNVTGSGGFDIMNVNMTQEISDILYEIYLNYPHSHYYKYPENIYNKICSAYAIIVKNNSLIRNMTTGILYQENDLFNFDIFDINIDDDFNHLNDVNLTYKPIELIDIGIDQKTKLPIPLEIDNINIKNTEFPYFTGRTEIDYSSIDSLSYMRSSVMIDDELHYLIQYQGKLFFNDTETKDGVYLQKYYPQNNATLVFNNNNLSETGLSYYYYMDNRGYTPTYNSVDIGCFNTRIKSDNSGNTYHFGYSTHTDVTWTWNNTYFELFDTSVFTSYVVSGYIVSGYFVTIILPDSIWRRGAAKNYDIGYLIKFDESGSNTAITHSGEVQRLTYTNDIEIINDYNYVYVANDGDYYQSLNGDSRNLLYDGPGGKKSTVLFKYSNDFTTIDWKILYYSLEYNGSISNILSTNKSLKLTKDDNEEFLYQTLSTTKGTNKLKIEKMTGYTYFYQYDSSLYDVYNTFSIIKMSKDGAFTWLKPIYYSDSAYSPTQIPELTNILFDEDYLYLSINTNTEIIIDNVTYGVDELGVKQYLIKMDKNSNVQWVKILGKTNDTIGTDIKIYNETTDNKYLYTSGYFTNYTKISNYEIYSNGISSYVTKIDASNGDIISVFDKQATETIKIKTLDIVDDNIYIGGDWIGGVFLGGKKPENYKTTTHSRVFVEQIKINSF